MKLKIQFLTVIGLMALGCKNNEIPKDTPDCIKGMIEQIKNQSVWNPPASVFRYVYNGKIVYYISPRCCDVPSVLYDENCQVLCSPDGGISGSGDGKCEDFFTARSAEKMIWKDARK